MLNIRALEPVKAEDTIFGTVATDSDFALLNEYGSRFCKSNEVVLSYKIDKVALQHQLVRIPEWFAHRECVKRINHYKEQIKALNRGELPTKILNHGHAKTQDLLKAYMVQNVEVLAELQAREIILKKDMDKNPQIAKLEIEIMALNMAIKQERQKKNDTAKVLRRKANVGRNGIALWNPDRTVMFSMGIFNESSS